VRSGLASSAAATASSIARSGWQRYRRGTRAGDGTQENRTQPDCFCAARTAAESEFGALIEPLDMTLDSAERVATEAWEAIRKGKRESFPRGKERFFVKVQRLFPQLVDRSVGAQARAEKTIAALDSLRRV